MSRLAGQWVAPFAAILLGVLPLQAQDSLPAVPAADSVAPAAAPGDSALYPRSPTSPMGALWRSLLIPGWGQATNNRKLTGSLFVLWEGVTLGMAIKTSHELSYLRSTGSARVGAKKKERQDWLVLLGFNHLFSAVEAYVSTHLYDFPGDLELRAVPGGVAGAVSIPVRLR